MTISKFLKFALSGALVFVSLSSAQAGFKAHEWGTFTSLVGSNGITVHGMYHEDEVLPDFVHGFGETRVVSSPVPPTPVRLGCHGKGCFNPGFYAQNLITQKMETPVIYFYSDQPQNVEVNVKFPDGLLTETFPAPVKTFPARSDLPTLGNGEMTFQLKVLPTLTGPIPGVDASNIYSHARNVASNIIQSGDEQEKFIFYRGLGRFQPKISIASKNGSLILNANAETEPQAAFLIDVNAEGQGQLMELGGVEGTTVSKREIQKLQTHGAAVSKSILTGELAKESLVQGLMSSGLNRDEATAMVDTWEHGYLKTPGLRLLYILPRKEVDHILPLSISPAPDALERAFVGRIEIMLDTEELTVLSDILVKQNSYDVKSLGRFAESKLRRVLEVYTDREIASHRIPDSKILGVFDGLINQAKNPSGV